MHFLLQFGGDKQENGIRQWGKNKRLKSIVKTEKRWLKYSKKILKRSTNPKRIVQTSVSKPVLRVVWDSQKLFWG
jgi:hypothetical protein